MDINLTSAHHNAPAADSAHRNSEPATTANSAEPLRYELGNGLRVILCEAPQPGLFSAQLWVKTGSIHEGELLGCGVSHYLEHMLFKGTAKRGPLDISAEVNALGGYINAYTTYDRTVYYIDGPSEGTEAALDILLDMGFHAALDAEQTARERDVILREIDMGLDDPDRRLMQAFTQTAFREHPYRHPIIGWRELFEQVSAEDLRHYYDHRYSTDNAVLVVVADTDFSQLQTWIAQGAESLRRHRTSPVSILPEPPQLSHRALRLEADSPLVRGITGYRIPGLNTPGAPALDVLARLLGGGNSSHLWQTLREEQELVSHISAGCWNPGSQGLLWISYTCDKGKREAVEAAINQELAHVSQNAFSQKAVEKIVRQSVVAELNGKRTAGGVAARLGAAEVVLGDLGYPARHLELLRAVSPAQVQEAASAYFHDHSATSVSLEPKGSIATARAKAQHGSSVAPFEEITFDNGARLLLQGGDSVGKVHLRFGALGGGLWEAPERRGATGILASLLTRDTQKRTAAAVAETIEQIGGSFSEFVGNNTFGIGIETLSEDAATAIDLLGQALLHRNSTKKSFEVERDGQIAALQEDDDEVLDWARNRLREQFFGSHPYAVDYLGREADLHALTLAETNALGNRLLTGANAVLAVSGKFDKAAMLDALSPILSALPAGALPVPALPQEADALAPAALRHLHREREQAVVLVGYPDVGNRANKPFLAAELLDEIFSGMSSRLFRRVREEQGLAYYVGSERISGLERGLFSFYAGTHPQHAARVLESIDEEVSRALACGLTQEELDAAKLRLRVRARQSQQLCGARAMQSVLSTLYGKGANAWTQFDARLDATTLEDLHAFCAVHFSPELRQALIVSPES